MRSSGLFMVPLLCLVLVGCPAGSEDGEDGGTDASDGGRVRIDGGGQDASTGCGTFTEFGECNGTVLRWCNAGTLAQIDCNDDGSACILIDPAWGYDCATVVGGNCLVDSTEFDWTFCQGTAPGCLDNESEFICTENLGVCTENQLSTCIGDRLIYDCAGRQSYQVDCPSYGATCSNRACRGARDGVFCDDDSVFCAGTCTFGTCTGAPVGDGGTTDGGSSD